MNVATEPSFVGRPFRALVAASALLALSCGASAPPTLVIQNTAAASGDLSEVLMRDCTSIYWSPTDAPLDPTSDLPPGGSFTLAKGAARALEIPPGCHDFEVKTGARVSRARVALDVGETATWVPFSIEEQTGWWCLKDSCP